MDEKFLEQASALEQSQRDARVKDVQTRLKSAGQSDCDGCGKPIAGNRRLAMPSAIRCLTCQSNFERIKGVGP